MYAAFPRGGALPEVTGRDGETVLQCKAGDVNELDYEKAKATP